MHDLWIRGAEQREAGAFLLASRHGAQFVRHWIAYDDLDANSLRYAYVKLAPSAFGRLSEFCSRLDMHAIADIHTHPQEPAQSQSDREHPMLAIPGHIALIAPHFAGGVVTPNDVSFNVYRGGGQWLSFFGHDAAALLIAP